jgi:hypothetical protein
VTHTGWQFSSDSEEDEEDYARPPAQRQQTAATQAGQVNAAVARALLSSDSEEDDTQQRAVAQAGQQVAAVAQAGQQVAAVAQAGQPDAAVARGLLSSNSEEDGTRQPPVQQARQQVAAAAHPIGPYLAAHFEAEKQKKAAEEASWQLRLRYRDQDLEEVLRQGAEPAAVAGAVAATAVVPPTSGPGAAAEAQSAGAQRAGAQRAGAQRAGAQPTTAQPAAAQPEKAQLQRRNEQLIEERPMRGPPRDEQFATSPLAIGTVGLSLDEAFAAECAMRPGQPAAAGSGLGSLVHKRTYGQQANSAEFNTILMYRIDSERVALDKLHNAQLGPEHASFSPPTLVALCLQAVRDEPRLHADVSSWDLARRRSPPGSYTDDGEVSELFEVLQNHMDKYRQLRGRLLVPYTINRYLFDYQREGVRFLADIFTGRRHAPGEEIKGGILADEMGLGKTIQVIGELRNPGLGRAGHGLMLTDLHFLLLVLLLLMPMPMPTLLAALMVPYPLDVANDARRSLPRGRAGQERDAARQDGRGRDERRPHTKGRGARGLHPPRRARHRDAAVDRGARQVGLVRHRQARRQQPGRRRARAGAERRRRGPRRGRDLQLRVPLGTCDEECRRQGRAALGKQQGVGQHQVAARRLRRGARGQEYDLGALAVRKGALDFFPSRSLARSLYLSLSLFRAAARPLLP